jgi:hypothetical protein
MEKTYAISLLGRLWRDSLGNTYHTARIQVNGEFVHLTPVTYGYDRQYEETAKHWLTEHGYIATTFLPVPPTLGPYCEYKGIKFDSISVDVKRKKELA